MGEKNRIRGINYEHDVVKMFKNAGYNAVRTAGSHSDYDVIAWKKASNSKVKKILFVAMIQCKTEKTKSS